MDAASEVKARLNIEDIVGEYVELKRAGRNYKGLSPFGSEKTPSFVVSPEKGIWHDFSSGKGGDVISFVMELEGMDFKQALEHLARKAGVDLAEFRGRGGDGNNAKQKERLFQASELAAKFYQVHFSKNRVALEYALGKRQFSKQTALEWQLGYSPDSGSALCDFLAGKGFTKQEVQAAGLAAASRYGNSGRLRDMFRGRLMIPLHDPTGRVIGFTARLLEGGAPAPAGRDAPKYINTPQTALYDKSRHVFGLHLAKEAIRKTKFVVIAEGNLDVISSHQAGVRQVVATAGTAMTEGQLKALSRFTGDIRVSYDQDKAGLNATERAIGVAGKVGVSLSMITVPSGKDPDELIRQDPQLWRDVIEKNQYALDWLIERYENLLDITTAQGKREFSDVLLPVVRGLNDSVEQDHYLQRIAGIIGVRQEALTDKYEQTTQAAAQPVKRVVRPLPPLDKRETELRRAQNRLLALSMMRPGLRRYLRDVRADMLPDEQARTLLDFLQQYPDFSGTDPAQVEVLRPVADYVKILSVAYEEEGYQDISDVDLESGAHQQLATIIGHYFETQQQKITEQYAGADDSARAELTAQYNELIQLLARSKSRIAPAD